MDIGYTAINARSFNTLVATVKAASLSETAMDKGPFTIFAPTDGKFAKLPKGTVEDLLKPEYKEKLVAILTYHVVSGKAKAVAVIKIKSTETVNGQEAKITAKDGKVLIDYVNIVIFINHMKI